MDLSKREKIGLIVFLIIMIFITSIFYFGNKSKNEIVVNSKESQVNSKKESSNVIKVYVYGEIKKPGVYTLKSGDRIEELIALAGGFTENAETSSINLALKLKDEDFIRISGKNQNINQNQPQSGGSGNANAVNGDKININTADKNALKELPRIGDALAQRIIDYRENKGLFKDIKDIMNVSGIGEKMFENIKDKIAVH